jgi:hypothetical protein
MADADASTLITAFDVGHGTLVGIGGIAKEQAAACWLSLHCSDVTAR